MSSPIVLFWLILANLYAFLLFGWDKWRARRAGASRVSEFHLLTASAFGGWPGALFAMLLFRHKTSKTSFKAKFLAALLIFLGLLWLLSKSGSHVRAAKVHSRSASVLVPVLRA